MTGADFLTLNEPFFVFGSNTNVGKTHYCSLVAALASQSGLPVAYFKPIQTGYPHDDDAGRVRKMAPQARTACGHGYREPIAPHRCAEREQSPLTDAQVVDCITGFVASWQEELRAGGLCLIEGAGGVLSPLPSGALAADAYRILRYPVVLVVDPNLGGISGAITAVEALERRGFDIALIISFASEHENPVYLRQWWSTRNREACVLEIPLDIQKWTPSGWMGESEMPPAVFDAVRQSLTSLCNYRFNRARRLRELQEESERVLWWPFTQHGTVGSPRVIDAAQGNNLTYVVPQADSGFSLGASGGLFLQQVFDGSASWWTSGVGHGHPGLAHEVGCALGRYGHVLFPEHTHLPAARLAVNLLDTVGAPWASRVFFSDNGSTAVEAALKMAFRRAECSGVVARGGMPLVLGLMDSYHGDTIGAMNAASPNGFNRRESWYRPSGFWIDFPKFAFRNGELMVAESEVFRCTEGWGRESVTNHECKDSGWPRCLFSSMSDLFNVKRRVDSDPALVSAYERCAQYALAQVRGRCGALLIEPCVHGSAGMIGVDPLFQHVLVRSARREGIPVVFDEVFSGFWRLGFRSAAEVLLVEPDIACYSKALTGGLVPLAVTLASDHVFDAFFSESKSDSLLHGHSYTAHPAGCSAAIESLRLYESHFKEWKTRPILNWSEEAAVRFSKWETVERVLTLGTLFAIELRSIESGYFSLGARKVVAELLHRGIAVRPLGSVVYLMSSVLAGLDDDFQQRLLAECAAALQVG